MNKKNFFKILWCGGYVKCILKFKNLEGFFQDFNKTGEAILPGSAPG